MRALPPAVWQELQPKLVAILRGIRPEETGGIVRGLLEAGFRAIEVPLNSPDPFRSIEIAVETARAMHVGPCLIGAGTVLSLDDVARVAACGANLVVSPNTDPEVIRGTVRAGLASMPGCFTATEALLALKSGAMALKFFPASILGPDGIRAIAAVLPAGTPRVAVGGVADGLFAKYLSAGVEGFGLGSSLYKPGDAAADVIGRGAAAVEAYRRATQAR